MTAIKRGRPRDEAIDAAIHDAAVDELIERGFIAFSMEGVAARAGVAKTTLYRRWSGPTELAIAVMRNFEEHAPVPPEAPIREQLRFLLEEMRSRWNDPRYAAIMRRALADGTAAPELYRQSRDRVVGPHLAAMQRVLERGVAAGTIRADLNLTWVRQLLSAPILAASLTLKGTVSAAQLETTLDVVLRGVAP